MTINIETDELGNRHWRCEGWTVTTWSDGRVDIDPPNKDTEVSADPDGLEVFGEESFGYQGSAGVRFVIPLPVLREIVRLMELQADRPEGVTR